MGTQSARDNPLVFCVSRFARSGRDKNGNRGKIHLGARAHTEIRNYDSIEKFADGSRHVHIDMLARVALLCINAAADRLLVVSWLRVDYNGWLCP